MSGEVMVKAPADRLDYTKEFVRWLIAPDAILSAIAVLRVVSPVTTTAVVDLVEFTTDTVRVWVSGGLNAEYGDIDVTITTIAGRIKIDCFELRIKDC